MVGLADSYLSELGYLVVPQVTVLPFLLAMWFHNRSLTGWAFASTWVLWWEFAVREGLNVNNPLVLYTVLPFTPTDLQQAQYLYTVVFSTLIVACAMMGTGVAWLLCLPYVLPLEAVWPESPGLAFNSPNIKLPNVTTSGLKRQDAAVPDDCGLSAFGFDRIPRPYFHFLATLILFVITVALPFILFEWLYATTILGAFLCGVFIPIVGYLFTGLFWRYYTSLYVFGPNDNNMKDRDNQLALSKKDDDSNSYNDPNTIPADFANTNYGIWKTILIMGGLHVLTFLLVGGIGSFSDPVDVDLMWIFAFTLILVITVLIAIVAFIYRYVVKARNNCNLFSDQQQTSSQEVGDETLLDSNIYAKNAINSAVRSLVGKK